MGGIEYEIRGLNEIEAHVSSVMNDTLIPRLIEISHGSSGKPAVRKIIPDPAPKIVREKPLRIPAPQTLKGNPAAAALSEEIASVVEFITRSNNCPTLSMASHREAKRLRNYINNVTRKKLNPKEIDVIGKWLEVNKDTICTAPQAVESSDIDMAGEQ